MTKKALITGITGQDGSFLAELLLSHGYEIHGMVRLHAGAKPENRPNHLAGMTDRLRLHPASFENIDELHRLIAEVRPDECYHLGVQTFIEYDFLHERQTLQTNVDGTHLLLAALSKNSPSCRFFFAGSSEMFGAVNHCPQDENTPLRPRSIYGISKVAGYHLLRYYREHHKMHASCGFLFNHESIRRGPKFVTRKISIGAARIKLGLMKTLTLGDLDARRDWGYAGDYVEAMRLILQQEHGDDYVIATNRTHSVREFVDTAFSHLGLDYRNHVEVDPRFVRPPEPVQLQGNSQKAQRELGWSPRKAFKDLVTSMVDHDLKMQQERATGV